MRRAGAADRGGIPGAASAPSCRSRRSASPSDGSGKTDANPRRPPRRRRLRPSSGRWPVACGRSRGTSSRSFAAERPGLAGGKARLPEPPRKLNSQEAAIVRGHADSVALRLACHDPAIHRRLQPGGQQSRAVFEAVEQARSRRSARGACKGWRRTSPPCSTTASTAASSTRSPTGRMPDRGCARPDRARAPHRAGSACCRPQSWCRWRRPWGRGCRTASIGWRRW